MSKEENLRTYYVGELYIWFYCLILIIYVTLHPVITPHETKGTYKLMILISL